MRSAEKAVYFYYADHPNLTAYHEAGHALVAYRCGWDVQSVRVGLTGTHGRSLLLPDDDDDTSSLVSHMAGVPAERRAEAWDRHWPVLVERRTARRVARAAAALRVRSIAPFEALVDDLLYEDRAGLDRLAAALVDRHELDGRAAVALLTGKAR